MRGKEQEESSGSREEERGRGKGTSVERKMKLTSPPPPRLALEEEMDANKALTNEITQQKVKAEFELERTRIDLQDTKVQYEKQYGDYARDRDAEVMSLRKGMDTSDKSFEAQRENLNSQIRKLETQRRQHERTIADMQKVSGGWGWGIGGGGG